VDGPGVWLEVSAVSVANHAVTFVLPKLGAKSGSFAKWFHCAECLDNAGSPGGGAGDRLRNAVGETNWTVSSAIQEKNNEGKLRFAVKIDAADAPFAANHEFEGYLACNTSRTWCGRITKTIANEHDVTGETFETWNDPRAFLSAGDELDVFYVRPTEGDEIVFINPFVVDSTGSSVQTMKVEDGSTFATISDAVFVSPYSPGNNQGGGSLMFQNTTVQRTVTRVLFDGPDGPLVTNALANWGAVLQFDDNVAGRGVSNAFADRVTVRFPQMDADFLGGMTLSTNSVRFSEQDIPDRWINYADSQAALAGAATGTNLGIRKLRTEADNYGVGAAVGPHFTKCPDGLYVQDFIALHGRTPNRDGADDQIEMWGNAPDCAVDRLAFSGTDNPITSGLNERDDGLGDRYDTSIVVFGGSGVVQSTSVPSPEVFSPMIFCQNDTGPGNCAGFVHVVNAVIDGMVSPNNFDYVARVGWWGSKISGSGTSTFMPGVSVCGETVGYFLHGSGGQDNVNLHACRGSSDTVQILDTVALSATNDQNDAETGIFQLSAILGSAATPLPLHINFDGILFVQPDASLTRSIKWINGNAGGPAMAAGGSISADNVVMAFNQSPSFYSWFEWKESLIPGGLILGKNLFFSAPTGPVHQWCRHDPGTGLVKDECEPYTVDGNPIPSADSMGLMGDLLNGSNVYPVSYTGTKPAGSDITQALPRYAGPIVYDWPMAWATLNPVPGFRRASPRLEFIPARLQKRMGIGEGVLLPFPVDVVHLAGAGDPNAASVPCANVGEDRYIDTMNAQQWYCSGTNTWLGVVTPMAGASLYWGDARDANMDTGAEVCAAASLDCMDAVEFGASADLSCSAIPTGNASGKFMAFCR